MHLHTFIKHLSTHFKIITLIITIYYNLKKKKINPKINVKYYYRN